MCFLTRNNRTIENFVNDRPLFFLLEKANYMTLFCSVVGSGDKILSYSFFNLNKTCEGIDLFLKKT